MKVRVSETWVRHAVVVIPDSDTLSGALLEAGKVLDAGDIEFASGKCVRRTADEITTDSGGTLMLQADGYLMVTQAGRAVFKDAPTQAIKVSATDNPPPKEDDNERATESTVSAE